jgi:hypothetical protein
MLKTKLARATWSNIAICSLLDVALAYVIARFVSPDEVLVTTAILVAVIWFAPLVFIFKGNIYKAILYHLNKSSVRTTLVQEFREAKLPLLSGTSFNDPSDLYFNGYRGRVLLRRLQRQYYGQSCHRGLTTS